MFERYTEKARRIIFFARYEASQTGSRSIETEHLLLALLREAKQLFEDEKIEPMRNELRADLRVEGPAVSTSVDLPLSLASKRVLAYAAEEAERFAQKHIGPEHMLLALMRDPETVAQKTLAKYGIAGDDLIRGAQQKSDSPAKAADVVTDLRWALAPLVERLTPEIEPAVSYNLGAKALS